MADRREELFRKAALQGVNEAPYVDVLYFSGARDIWQLPVLLGAVFSVILLMAVLLLYPFPVSYRNEAWLGWRESAGLVQNSAALCPRSVEAFSKVSRNIATSIRVGDGVMIRVRWHPAKSVSLEGVVAALERPRVQNEAGLATICLRGTDISDDLNSMAAIEAMAYFRLHETKLISLLLGSQRD